MSMPSVIVKKGGFLSALAHGFFGLLITIVICATWIGVYAFHIADNVIDDAVGLSTGIVTGLPDWLENLPPALSDSLHDRRADDYRDQIDVSVREIAARDHARTGYVVVEVTNRGSETISLLALNVTLTNEDNVPLRDFRTYAATPFALDEDEWRGPLMPGSTRHFSTRRGRMDEPVSAAYEVVDLRVFRPMEELEQIRAERRARRQAEQIEQYASQRDVSAAALPRPSESAVVPPNPPAED